MQVHYGRLYVGTATLTEIIRINPDDTWDLVVGPPRQVPGTGEWKYPISNLDAGFGHTLNDHAWHMEDPYNFLYVGTYNIATGARFDPRTDRSSSTTWAPDMYRTPDDWYYSAVMTNGFANAGDPQGGNFDYGIRTMTSTPYGAVCRHGERLLRNYDFPRAKGCLASGCKPHPARHRVEQAGRCTSFLACRIPRRLLQGLSRRNITHLSVVIRVSKVFWDLVRSSPTRMSVPTSRSAPFDHSSDVH